MKISYFLLILALLPVYAQSESLIYLSHRAKAICEDSEGYDYEERFQLVRTLEESPSMGDLEYYLTFMERPFSKGRLSKGQFNTLKNDLADKLLMQRRLPRKVSERFLKMIDQQALGAVWRDYVLQKLPDLYDRVEKDDRAQILEKLWQTAANVEHTFSGTALLSLRRIDTAHLGTVELNQFSQKTLAVIKEAKFPEQNKVTALQMLMEIQHPETLNLARKILNVESNVMLRVSAIGVLGLIGQSEDREILSTYIKSPEFRVRQAAQSALKKLDS